MIRHGFVRRLVGLALGAAFGAILCVVVLPVGLNLSGYGNPQALGYYLKPYIIHAALVMGLGGWWLARSKRTVVAAQIFSLTTMLTSAGLAKVSLQASPRLLVVASLAGVIYGLCGGLIMARFLTAPSVAHEETDQSAGD